MLRTPPFLQHGSCAHTSRIQDPATKRPFIHSFILLARFKGTRISHIPTHTLRQCQPSSQKASCYLSVSQAKVLGVAFDLSVSTHVPSPGQPVNPSTVCTQNPPFQSTPSTPTSGPSVCLSASHCPLNRSTQSPLETEVTVWPDTQERGHPYPPLHCCHLVFIRGLRVTC